MKLPFIEARHFTEAARGPSDVDLVVLHDMEYPERLDAAERVARWFAGDDAPQASAHYSVDADSAVQSVHEKDVAWHAPGANHNGIGIEHAGYARQTAADWDDRYSRAMLDRSAKLSADIARRYHLPILYLRAADLLAGKRGLTTHLQVSLAFRRSDHSDPGLNFPIESYLARVRREITVGPRPGQPRPVKKPEPVLRAGAKGWRVKQAQRLLVYAGERLHVDGIFGPATVRGTQHFQKRAGLRADGVIGANTWRALWQARYLDGD